MNKVSISLSSKKKLIGLIYFLVLFLVLVFVGYNYIYSILENFVIGNKKYLFLLQNNELLQPLFIRIFLSITILLLVFFIFYLKGRLLLGKMTFKVLLFSFLILILAFNFSYNFLNLFENRDFWQYQLDSEALVTGTIDMKLGDAESEGYGLTYSKRYYDVFFNIYDQDRASLKSNGYKPYESQFGLQGMFFSIFYSNKSTIGFSKLFTVLTLSLILLSISYLINIKFNKLMGACFYLVFLLSPYIVNFARNLFWVEFSWFIPMLVGLLCSIHYRQKKRRIALYLLGYFSILLKSLCGYEYISTIMLSLISFLVVDFVVLLKSKDKSNLILLLKTILIMGLFALLGFFTSLLLHANIRGDGSIVSGLIDIWNNDVLRRTLGGDSSNFNIDIKASLDANIVQVIIKYLFTSKDVISGISGNFFLGLFIIPGIVFLIELKRKKMDLQELSLYLYFLIMPLSWFLLGKAHSYIHVSLNFVLWYTGFIQVSIYIIIKRVLYFVKSLDLNLLLKKRREVTEV